MLVDGASASASEAHTTLQGVALCGDGVAWCGCEWVFQIWMVLSVGSESVVLVQGHYHSQASTEAP